MDMVLMFKENVFFLIDFISDFVLNKSLRHFQALPDKAVRCDSGHTAAVFRKLMRMPYARSTLPERMHLVQT
jgi:hypothetical protein